MGNSSKALKLVLATGLAATLAGCGGSDSPSRTTDTTTTTTTTTDSTGTTNTTDTSSLVANNPPHSIVITYPNTDAVQDDSWGYYRRKVSALVQDADGHPVADGTVVYLGIVDSVLAQGSVPTGGIAATTTFTDAGATLGDGSTATQLDAAYVMRNGAHRFIQEEDVVLLTDNAEEEDKIRYVNADTLTATSLTTTQAYTNSYPSTNYPAGSTTYVVGASLLGTQVAGESQGGATTTTEATAVGGGAGTTTTSSGTLTAGVATTVDGVAQFRITYPANLNTLGTGCYPATDTRVEPTGSAQVFLTARVNDAVTTVDDRFCFSAVNDGSIELTRDAVTAASNDTIDVSFRLRDGGDAVPVPFWQVGAYVSATPSAGSAFTVQAGTVADPTAGYVITDADGWGTVRINVANGLSEDTATVVLRALNATAEISVSVLTNGSIDLDQYSILGTAGNSTTTVGFTVSDRGQQVTVPSWTVSSSANPSPATGSNLSVQVSSIVVDQTTGQGTATIQVANAIAGDSATIELGALGATAEISFAVP